MTLISKLLFVEIEQLTYKHGSGHLHTFSCRAYLFSKYTIQFSSVTEATVEVLALYVCCDKNVKITNNVFIILFFSILQTLIMQ